MGELTEEVHRIDAEERAASAKEAEHRKTARDKKSSFDMAKTILMERLGNQVLPDYGDEHAIDNVAAFFSEDVKIATEDVMRSQIGRYEAKARGQVNKKRTLDKLVDIVDTERNKGIMR